MNICIFLWHQALESYIFFYFECDHFVKPAHHSKSGRKNQCGMEVVKWFWQMKCRKIWTRMLWIGEKKSWPGIWLSIYHNTDQAFMVEPEREGHAEWNSGCYSAYYELLQLSLIVNLAWHWNFLPVLMNSFSAHLMKQGCFVSSFQGRNCPLSEGQAKSLVLVPPSLSQPHWHPFLRLQNPMK